MSPLISVTALICATYLTTHDQLGFAVVILIAGFFLSGISTAADQRSKMED